MSAIIIAAIEGVLTKVEEQLPVADPYLAGVELMNVFAERWSIGYVTTTTDASKARTWLRESPAPDGAFVLATSPERIAATILAELGRRGDRCQFFLTGSADGLGTLMSNGVATLFVRHESFLLSDWRRTSSWKGPDDGHEAPLHRVRGSEAP